MEINTKNLKLVHTEIKDMTKRCPYCFFGDFTGREWHKGVCCLSYLMGVLIDHETGSCIDGGYYEYTIPKEEKDE